MQTASVDVSRLTSSFPFNDQLTELIPRSVILAIKSWWRAHHTPGSQWCRIWQFSTLNQHRMRNYSGYVPGAFTVGGLHVYFCMSRKAETAGGLCQCQCVEIVEIC